MAPAQAVFIDRNVFERHGKLWGPSRRLGRPPDAMPMGLLVSGKRAAAMANEPIVDALLQVLALAGWRMRRWLTLRACCCTSRDALPAFYTDESLQATVRRSAALRPEVMLHTAPLGSGALSSLRRQAGPSGRRSRAERSVLVPVSLDATFRNSLVAQYVA